MKKLIFDFDGTLVDSMKYWGGAMLAVLDDNGVEYPENIIETLTPLGYIGSSKYYIEKLGMQKSEEEIIAEITAYAVSDYTTKIVAKKYVKETLMALKNEGFSLNVLTASPHVVLDVCLKRNGLYELFDNVWSCDDFFTTKGDPRLYQTVAGELSTTVENCAFFDDNVNSLRCGKSSGMTVVGVYDESSEEATPLIKELCNAYICDFSEIEKIKDLLI